MSEEISLDSSESVNKNQTWLDRFPFYKKEQQLRLKSQPIKVQSENAPKEGENELWEA